MQSPAYPPSPSPDELPFQTIGADEDAKLVILCDHASAAVPARYGSLGLPKSEFERHIAYDIGARALALGLRERLGATAVLSTFSRLLVDPNRGPDDPTVLMRLSDGTVVPGNHPIDACEIARRIETYHAAYHGEITRVLDACAVPPLIFSIHSFTPSWKGVPRPWHTAVLWDHDPRLNLHVLDALKADASLFVGENEPYEGGLVGDTIYRHATTRGLAHCLIEVRQDLIAEQAGVDEWVDRLATILEPALDRPDMHETRFYGSRFDGSAKPGGHYE